MSESLSHLMRTSGANRLAVAPPLPLSLAAAIAAAASAPAGAAQRVEIANDLSRCSPGAGPALLVTVSGIKSSKGKIRVQSYRATKAEWLEKGKWINRIEAPAKAGTMTFCMPLPQPGTYGIAVRHDINGNGKTDLGEDGGGMSNNPAINLFNLGKPSHTKVGVEVADAPRAILIHMKYM
jgi:uncharacterized protein (DUF2141 family)